jgi:hypothetical protein
MFTSSKATVGNQSRSAEKHGVTRSTGVLNRQHRTLWFKAPAFFSSYHRRAGALQGVAEYYILLTSRRQSHREGMVKLSLC